MAVESLPFTHIPHELLAEYFSRKSDTTKKSYWVMRTLEEVEKAIIRQPTIGYLWEWDARLRKYLGMRYREFFRMSIWIDPFRINPAEVLEYLTVKDFLNEKNLLQHLTNFYGSWRFLTRIITKLWENKEGREFLLGWEPENSRVTGALALFLARKGLVERALYLAEATFNRSPSSAYPALSFLVRKAYSYEKKGENNRAENLYLKIFKIAPGADYLPVKIVMFYLKRGKIKRARYFYNFYLLNRSEYPATLRLKKMIEREKIFK